LLSVNEPELAASQLSDLIHIFDFLDRARESKVGNVLISYGEGFLGSRQLLISFKTTPFRLPATA